VRRPQEGIIFLVSRGAGCELFVGNVYPFERKKERKKERNKSN
jgi:hypothetical protein